MKFKTAEEHLCEERQAVIDELDERRALEVDHTDVFQYFNDEFDAGRMPGYQRAPDGSIRIKRDCIDRLSLRDLLPFNWWVNGYLMRCFSFWNAKRKGWHRDTSAEGLWLPMSARKIIPPTLAELEAMNIDAPASKGEDD